LAIAKPHGLIVDVRLPMAAITEANA